MTGKRVELVAETLRDHKHAGAGPERKLGLPGRGSAAAGDDDLLAFQFQAYRELVHHHTSCSLVRAA